jgi:hypothetical protein
MVLVEVGRPPGWQPFFFLDMVWRSSRGRPLNAPAAFIHPCQPIVATRLAALIVLSQLRNRTFRAVLAITNSHAKRECLQ